MKKALAIVIFWIIVDIAHAQTFGGNPASARWQKIDTDTVRVIFPAALRAGAQRIANIIHTLQREQARTIGTQLRKTSIVLQNQTMFSNAYVQLAPRRSEFYLTPPQDPFELDAVNWADKLALHEYRHVQQYNNFNKGFSRFASLILGQEGQALANAASIPDWFFEGDAVFNETKLSGQGRGALPSFLSSYQSLSHAGRQYNYAQMRNGSMRKYVPNHYELGYLLVAYGRKKYGDDIWQKVTDDAARFKPFLYPFQGAVKKHTGIAFKNFAGDAMTYYGKQWQSLPAAEPQWLTATEKNNVVNYKYPYALPDGSLVVLKNSYRKPPAFYRIYPDGREEKIANRGIPTGDHFSYNNGRIVYAAYQPDARWGNREFTRLQLLDVASGAERSITSRSRYLSPDISHDGQKIIAVEMDELGENRLVVMNTSGMPIDSVKSKGILFSNPKFSADDSHYYVAGRNDAGEMSLIKYGKGTETILPFANRLIGFINVRGDTISFSVSSKDRDEIWAVIDGPAPKGPYRLASYVTGLYQADLLPGGKLVASAFTADGYRLAGFRPEWEKVSDNNTLTHLYVADAYKKNDQLLLRNVPNTQYPVSAYRKSADLLNFHSYRPYFEDPEYSFTLYGENVLNTLQSELAYTYNSNEGSHKAGYNGIYGGSYVQPVFGISQTWQRSALFAKDTVVNWNELIGYAGLQLPLNLSGGKAYRYLSFSGIFNVDQVKWTGIATKLLKDRQLHYLTARIAYTAQVQKAVQQIYPHWAQSLFLQYKTAVNSYAARQFLASGSVYLPGLGNNHNLVLSAAFHSRDTLNQYLFSNNFPFARGYTAVDFPRMWKLGVNYHLPLAYPDWGFGNIVYFLRIRSNLFYDYSRGRSLRTGIEYPFNTVGTELFFDTKWWNQQPVSFGLRYSRLLNNEFRGATRPNVWELILPVSLFE